MIAVHRVSERDDRTPEGEIRVKVEAQVTGRVVRVEKQVGDRVETEDVLLVLESMKMEIPVVAPIAGKIVEIRVDEKDQVQEGDVLVVIE